MGPGCPGPWSLSSLCSGPRSWLTGPVTGGRGICMCREQQALKKMNCGCRCFELQGDTFNSVPWGPGSKGSFCGQLKSCNWPLGQSRARAQIHSGRGCGASWEGVGTGLGAGSVCVCQGQAGAALQTANLSFIIISAHGCPTGAPELTQGAQRPHSLLVECS